MAELREIHQAYYRRLRTVEGLGVAAAFTRTKSRFPYADQITLEASLGRAVSHAYTPTSADRIMSPYWIESPSNLLLYSLSGAVVLCAFVGLGFLFVWFG